LDFLHNGKSEAFVVGPQTTQVTELKPTDWNWDVDLILISKEVSTGHFLYLWSFFAWNSLLESSKSGREGAIWIQTWCLEKINV